MNQKSIKKGIIKKLKHWMIINKRVLMRNNIHRLDQIKKDKLMKKSKEGINKDKKEEMFLI